MCQPEFDIISPKDNKTIELIADCYLSEWNISKDKTIHKINSFAHDTSQFQAVMTLNGVPVTTAGLYHEVGLLDKEPRFRAYQNWLALVYTIPVERHKGLGALICNYIDDRARKLGVQEMHLFTDTAEPLYKRLGWQEAERFALGERNVVVMKKNL